MESNSHPSRAAIEAHQLEQIRSLVAELFPGNKFYSRKLNAAGITFDGRTLWVANGGADTVVGLNPKTGATSVAFVTGRSPSDVISDGVNIWVANRGSDSVSTTAAVQ